MSAHDSDRTFQAHEKHVVRRVDGVTGALEQLADVLDQEEQLPTKPDDAVFKPRQSRSRVLPRMTAP